ncbi:hypothetical protein HBI81_217930 [Parastagonospora nodorum]|nr:hypothetical protein HBH42_229820 [Parastagonospora nodorum]KAH5651831.1 hypothetical protein HBI51_082140 [Parastagonospora nodorum]KAH5725852.1 hypothetical protein HBI17_238810 [Parastagonospora nodorum]KAH6287243.1 hypothetical protein HBI39_224770 [Parastagonospora nodorum]KAH6513536.1 hypothetical protein HBI81_217930 [Parastagonospora nodorum]
MENSTSSKTPVEANIPSCESCRKRKLKCTREQPSCSNCDKFATVCVYEYDKKKPGFKVGAVESLSRRLDVVERALSINHDTGPSHLSFSPASSTGLGAFSDAQQQNAVPVLGALSSLTEELRGLASTIASTQRHAMQQPVDDDAVYRKRQRTDDPDTTGTTSTPMREARTRPHDKIVSLWHDVIDAHFRFVHPWISILHDPSVRKELHVVPRKEPLPLAFQAMVVSSLRFVRRNGVGSSVDFHVEHTSRARQEILASVTEQVSIESCQALLILIYAELVDDNAFRASALLGMAARCVEQLQLAVETPHRTGRTGVFGQSHVSIASTDWIEEEERKRLFWNYLMLDRLCMVLLGCATTLSRERVHRRLPACASFWGTNQPRPTPYLRLIHASFPEFVEETSSKSSSDGEDEDLSSSGIGALAFYIETVESLGTIEVHFLRQLVDCSNSNHVARWLTRFKELDAYLMRWKMRLPQQWRDSGISRRVLPGVMDPAMTAANATHNTCLILLHERIAYPDQNLHWVQLPSLDSAEICVRAATEVCTIITKFLEQRPAPYALAPQLGLTAFVSARTLLIQWRHHRTQLSPAFWLLLESLDTMGARWAAHREAGQLRLTSIFSRFAGRLRTMHANCNLDSSYRIDLSEPLYENVPSTSKTRVRHWVSPNDLVSCLEQNRTEVGSTRQEQAPAQVVHDGAPLQQDEMPNRPNLAFSNQADMPWDPMNLSQLGEGGSDNGSLLAISQSLLDPDFTSMDRIVSFDEMMLGNISETWDLG